ncbi:hypothetical protein [Robertmurraya massiliosenegalensis]|uniref:hypothetical protein n=1 Tax=Robertmurraya massiliosenegalensis TaxID=1287657 RepID=UPI00030D6D73|nr:hypothetical protein [Robertmurraya massiliosenegalensis]
MFNLKSKKFLVGALFLILIVGSSVNVAFAGQDIHSLLSSWFQTERSNSIAEIEEAVAIEQEIQTERLKEELRLGIENAERQLENYTDKMKANSISEIQKHADQLVNSIEIDQSEEKNNVTSQLEAIIQDAKNKIDAIASQPVVAPDGDKDTSK